MTDTAFMGFDLSSALQDLFQTEEVDIETIGGDHERFLRAHSDEPTLNPYTLHTANGPWFYRRLWSRSIPRAYTNIEEFNPESKTFRPFVHTGNVSDVTAALVELIEAHADGSLRDFITELDFIPAEQLSKIVAALTKNLIDYGAAIPQKKDKKAHPKYMADVIKEENKVREATIAVIDGVAAAIFEKYDVRRGPEPSVIDISIATWFGYDYIR